MDELRKLVRGIVSDSTPVEAPKDPDSSAAFALYENFATPEAIKDMRVRLAAGGTGRGAVTTMGGNCWGNFSSGGDCARLAGTTVWSPSPIDNPIAGTRNPIISPGREG